MNQEYIYMPNEIFEDLTINIDTSSHRAFAYAYIYYTTYLYRYCKYQADQKNTQAEIKQRLGYNPTNKKIDYIIKKDGLLDSMGYTLTTTNYPVSWHIDDFGILLFKTISEVKNESNIPIISEKNFKVKHPLRAFFRTDEDEKSMLLTGTFYDVSNTHRIDYSIFDFMMREDKLGVNAFYIYGFIRYKNAKFPLYQASFENLAEELGCSKTTLAKYVTELESYKFLKVKHQKFKLGKSGEANTYKAIEKALQ